MTSPSSPPTAQDSLAPSLTPTRGTIHTLPDELILETFHQVFEGYIRPRPGSGFISLREREFLPITHVCHQWREIAISTPYFWSWVDMQDPGLAMLCLERYRSLIAERRRCDGEEGVVQLSGGGLRVWAEYRAGEDIRKEIVDEVLALLGNVKVLVFGNGLTEETGSALVKAISQAGPILSKLEDIEIQFQPSHDFPRYSIDLRNLPSVWICTLPLMHLIITPKCFARSLLRLNLQFDRIVGMDCILDALDGTYCLESLEIRFPCMHHEDGDNVSGRIPISLLSTTDVSVAATPRSSPVQLLSLKSLVINTRYGLDHVRHFFSNVELPQSLEEGINICTSCPSPASMLPPTGNSRIIFSPLTIPPEEKHRLMIHIYHYRFIARLDTSWMKYINVDFAPINPPVTVPLATRVMVEEHVLWWGTIFASPNVRVLDIYSNTFVAGWRQRAHVVPYALMYNSCPNIEELVLSGGSILASLSALNNYRTRPTGFGPVHEVAIMGKKLRKICVEVGLPYLEHGTMNDVLEMIWRVMACRNQFGARVESVVMTVEDVDDVEPRFCAENYEDIAGRIRSVVGEFEIVEGEPDSGTEDEDASEEEDDDSEDGDEEEEGEDEDDGGEDEDRGGNGDRDGLEDEDDVNDGEDADGDGGD